MPFPNFSISADTLNGSVDGEVLHEEIVAAGPYGGTFEGVSYIGDDLTINFDSPTPADGATVTGVVSAHAGVDALAAAKEAKFDEIDRRTDELINLGFTFGGDTFSLKQDTLPTLNGLWNARAAITYPVKYNTSDNSSFVLLNNSTDVESFYFSAVGTFRSREDSGTILKDAVRAATTVAQVDAIVDPR